MRSILKSINKIDEYRWMIGSYFISVVYVSVVYLLSFLVPALKKLIQEYEKSGSGKSIASISSISSVPFAALLGYLFYIETQAVSVMDIVVLVVIYAGYFAFGFFAMTLWHDYLIKAAMKDK